MRLYCESIPPQNLSSNKFDFYFEGHAWQRRLQPVLQPVEWRQREEAVVLTSSYQRTCVSSVSQYEFLSGGSVCFFLERKPKRCAHTAADNKKRHILLSRLKTAAVFITQSSSKR